MNNLQIKNELRSDTKVNDLKRIAAIHDLSGYGKCSLTIALPVISAAGIECSCLPTAVLSTHTGGFKGYTIRDLTCDMYNIAKHWSTLGIHFDAIYSGYLCNSHQAGILKEIINLLKDEKTMVIIDPVMGDNGKYYSNLGEEICNSFKKLCSYADIIIPNFTEASFLLNEEYKKPPYTHEYVEGMLKKLSNLGPSKIVLTGVSFNDNEIGAACYDSKTNKIHYALSKKIDISCHGTGDLFASALSALVVRGMDIDDALEIAIDFVHESIYRTYIRQTPPINGVDFEGALPQFIKRIQEI